MTITLARSLAAALLFGGLMQGAGVKVLFNPSLPEVGPFPTDALTVPDPAQKTGLRINMPLPDCQVEPSTCAELAQVNSLDGFSVEPRLRIRFSGPVDPDTLRNGIFVVWLSDLTNEEFGLQPFFHPAPINAVMYDPATNTAYAELDEILSQHRRYALVVTDGVRDRKGDPVEPDPAFLACAVQPGGYCGELAGTLGRVALQTAPRRVVGGSFFTTLSATAWLEKARAAIRNAPLGFQRAKPNNIFNMADLNTIVYRAQTSFVPKAFTNYQISPLPGETVGQVAFGSFLSPDFMNGSAQIPNVPTGSTVALPMASSELVFCAWLPKAPPPPAGYPVVIVSQGASSFLLRTSSWIATALAERGFATVAINLAGQGYGTESTVVLTDKAGVVTELPGGGRTPASAAAVPEPAMIRDSFRQTALDMMQLVRLIKAGVDLNGDGINDLDGNRIYFVGQSLGAMIGTILHAVEPDIRAAVLSDGAASMMDQSRWTKDSISTALMGARKPPLLNTGKSYDAAYALRYQAPKIIDVSGAIAIQEWFERAEWVSMPGDPLAYAPHLKSSTLPQVPMKPTLFQIEFADRTAPNPAGANLVRAANQCGSASLYRHDLALAVAPKLSLNPHGIFYIPPGTPEGQAIWAAGQKQIVEFLASDGALIVDVNDLVRPVFGKALFETPPQWLPEALNY